MKPKVYIDGKDGTTGLQIYDRLSARNDIELLLIDEENRKNPEARRALINAADLVFLCLPDAAAAEAVGLADNPDTKIIDCSTAHRTAPGWTYGFPELSENHREAIRNSKRVANPGCHASGFISLVYPLISAGVLPKDALLSCFSLTGYSGGGKKMIAEYEAPDRMELLSSPAVYAIAQSHKHLQEMQKICALEYAPVFSPIVADYYKGMTTVIPLHMAQLRNVATIQEVRRIYETHYHASGNSMEHDVSMVHVEKHSSAPRFYGSAMADSDRLSIFTEGNDERFALYARFDNLGKGASGAAVQNMNLMLGFGEYTGLSMDAPGMEEEET